MNKSFLNRFLDSFSDNQKSKIENLKWIGVVAIIVTFAMCWTAAQAQSPKKAPRIGVLISASSSTATRRIEAFQQGLRELGYVEGKNIIIEYRYAGGKPETLPERVEELIHLNVDIIITDTSNAINAAKNATKTIPVVFTVAIDPVGDGQVSSLARPGGNLTGESTDKDNPSFAGRIDALRAGLRELGYIEDKTIQMEWRFAEGKVESIPALVAELVRLKVDALVSAGSSVTGPFKEATQTIPIVMAQDTDPVGNGFIASLARPGGNITGLSSTPPS